MTANELISELQDNYTKEELDKELVITGYNNESAFVCPVQDIHTREFTKVHKMVLDVFDTVKNNLV